ncbi:MAG: glycerate kinase [Glaciihabitans sp.]|nr:glycerate kinase [Glaciihabitans sp.]
MPLTVVIAPDSFKGTLAAGDVAEAIATGWRDVRPADDIRIFPQADGGEGTLDAIERAVPGAVRRSAGVVTGPDGRPTPGEWLQLADGTAVVELAQPSGLPLMSAPDATGATTRGLGEVIAAALDAGATALAIGLGGSASTDGGAGALRALGLRLTDANGDGLDEGGGPLVRLVDADRAGLRPAPPTTLLTDVDAPLLGPRGAAAVFGPQKGASTEQVAELDAALATFARVLGGDPNQSGTGAAGGTAFGFVNAWGAVIEPGADYLAKLSGVSTAIASADVLLTGEGRFDAQSLGGKVVGQLLSAAAAHGIPSGVIAGQLSADPPVWACSLTDLAGSAEQAMAETARWLRAAGAEAARALGTTGD